MIKPLYKVMAGHIRQLRERLASSSTETLVLLGVVTTSAASLILQAVSSGASGASLVAWTVDWLRDFSTDLAGGGLTFLFIKWLWLRREAPGLPGARTTTFIIDAEEEDSEVLPRPDNAPLNIPQLRTAATPETRQPILDRAREQDTLGHARLAGLDLQYARLKDANLYRVDFTRSNLRGANLENAKLGGAVLVMAQLIEAVLRGADLREAILERAFLSGADFERAVLIGAVLKTTLWGCNLRNADMKDADLREAEIFRSDLTGADLTGAVFEGARIGDDTILPDGSYWNRKSEIRKFTDPAHPSYWRSNDPGSPAYVAP